MVTAGPVAIPIGQWAGLGLEETCRTARSMGYEGLEIVSQSQVDLQKTAEDPEYVGDLRGILEKYGLGRRAIGIHLLGRCVGNTWDPRLDGFAPAELAGKPGETRVWGIQQLKYAAMAARVMGIGVMAGLIGSPIWKMWYSFSQTAEEIVEARF